MRQIMIRSIKVSSLALILLYVTFLSAATASPICPSQLPSLINNLLNNSPITAHSRWGIYVEDINNQTGQGKTLYSSKDR